MNFDNKLVAIINKDIDTGVAMNALAHASLAIGGIVGKDALFLQDYKDADGNVWPISGMPYIILRAKSSEIRKALAAAAEAGILRVAFTETMTGGTYVEQLERTAQTAADGHTFYAAVLYGSWDCVSAITRKFSLYK